MRSTVPLLSFRFAMLSSLGLLHGCGAATTGTSQEPFEQANAGTNSGAGTGPGSVTGTTTPMGSAGRDAVGTAGQPPVTVTTPTNPNGGGAGTPVTTTPSVAGSGGTGASVCDGPESPFAEGLLACANGIVHRTQGATCASIYPRAEPVQLPEPAAGGSAGEPGSGAAAPAAGGLAAGGAASGGAEVGGTSPSGDLVAPPEDDVSACSYDADCTELPHGRCEAYVNEFGGGTTYCSYDGCTSDADCGTGSVCECGDDIGHCASATCTTDADCTAGNVCARFEFESGCGLNVNYACTHAADACRAASDCPDVFNGCQPSRNPEQPGAVCGGLICSEGRPFLIGGVARVAEPEFRADWLTAAHPRLADLSAAERESLANEWERIGLLDHASIAAFARFALQLLSVGAPPELLEATQQAMADETLHAKLAFGLVSGYRGVPSGPGRLSCDGALASSDLESITLNTVLEGCIGETLAALDAQEALAHCTDPAVADVLRVIARDEARHAELAWKFVQWALDTEPSLAKAALALVQAEAHRAAREVSPSDSTTDWTLAHGILPEAQRTRLRRAAMETVVAPCMQALCAASGARVAAARSAFGDYSQLASAR